MSRPSCDVPSPSRRPAAVLCSDRHLALYTLQLEGLADTERQALTLVQAEGASYAEAAGILGITRHEVQRLVFEGRCRIQAGLERSYAALRARSDN